MRNTPRIMKLGACALLLMVAGCGDDKAPKPSQVLARVNGQDITVLQLNYLLAQNANRPAAQQRSKQQLLEELIQQEMLVQQADELKLDRKPEVLQALEFTKRQVLAQAAYGQLAGSHQPIPDADIRTYYSEHPHLFAERQIYEMTLFLAPAKSFDDKLADALQGSTNASETSQLLDQAKVTYTRTNSKVPAEVLPVQVLETLHKINLGDIVQVREGDNLVLMQLKARQDAPLTLEKAHDIIVKLMNTGKLQSGDVLAALRAKAKVEYVQPLGDDAASVPSDAVESPATPGDDHLKSGLKGL